MDRAGRETWAQRVEAWKASGLSAAEFAAEHGINARSLTWWRWHLTGEKAPRQRAKRQRSAPSASTPLTAITTQSQVSPLTFVEMAAPLVASAALEIVMPSTIRIYVRPGFDSPTLGRVLDVLEQRR